jgi:hypothetical protein
VLHGVSPWGQSAIFIHKEHAEISNARLWDFRGRWRAAPWTRGEFFGRSEQLGSGGVEARLGREPLGPLRAGAENQLPAYINMV